MGHQNIDKEKDLLEFEENLNKWKKIHSDGTTHLSNLVRQYALGYLATIWLMITNRDKFPEWLLSDNNDSIDYGLWIGLIFILITLALDISHYLYKTYKWYRFWRKNRTYYDEVKKSNEEYKFPKGLDNKIIEKINKFFYAKVILLLISYGIIILFSIFSLFKYWFYL